MILHSPFRWSFKSLPSPVEYLTLDATSCGALWICTRVHGAAAFCARELLIENYGKHLTNSKRSTLLSESRA
jgi:hypothetical protein